MGAVLISLLPFIIGTALVPVQITINLLLLKNPHQGLLKAIAFLSGMTVIRLLQGFIFGLVLSSSPAIDEGGDGKNPITATLLLVLGILLLVVAYRKWRREDDPDDSPPKLLSAVDNLSPLRAFEIGLGLPLIAAKSWVFILSALSTIAAAQLGRPDNIIVYLIFVVLAQSLIILPILARMLLPERSKYFLGQLSAWLSRNSRSITIVVSLVFGLYFLRAGIIGLTA